MRWTVGVDGPQNILDQLGIAVSDRDIRLNTGRGGVVLSGSQLESLDDIASVQREAARIVSILSGFARLVLGSTEPLQVLDITEERAEGDVIARVASAAHQPHPRDSWPQSSLFQSLRLALSNPAIEKALRLRDAASLDWHDLLEICTVIEEEAGGKAAVAKFSGVTEAALQRIHDVADSVLAGHVAARRCVGEVLDRPRPVTLSEAEHIVDRLLVTWLSIATRQSAHVPPRRIRMPGSYGPH
jgi:hypothetical protein